MKKWLSYILMAGCLASCIYPYDIDLEETDEGEKVLVVDGEIVLGGTSTVRLGYMNPLSKSHPQFDLPDGKVWIEDNTGVRFDCVGAQSGNYFTIPTENYSYDRTYRAVIEVDGNTYTSDWQKPVPAPEFENIYFEADDDFVTAYVDLDTSGDAGTGYLSFSYEETWRFHADFNDDFIVNTETWAVSTRFMSITDWCWRSYRTTRRILLDYTNLQGRKVKKYPVISFSRYNNRNHKRYSANIMVSSLSKENYLYNKQSADQLHSGGDLFSPDPGALQGNLICETDPSRMVLGLVVICEVKSRRVYLDSRYLKHRNPNTSDLVPIGVEEYPFYYYQLNYRPVTYLIVDDQPVLHWGPLRCIDCVADGGTKERPDFWED